MEKREREGGGGGEPQCSLFICARPRVRTQYLCMQMALSEDTQQRKVENRKKIQIRKTFTRRPVHFAIRETNF